MESEEDSFQLRKRIQQFEMSLAKISSFKSLDYTGSTEVIFCFQIIYDLILSVLHFLPLNYPIKQIVTVEYLLLLTYTLMTNW